MRREFASTFCTIDFAIYSSKHKMWQYLNVVCFEFALGNRADS